MQMRGELRERRIAPELDRAEHGAEGIRECELRIETREVNKPKQPHQQATRVGLLPRDERNRQSMMARSLNLIQVLRPGDIYRRHNVPAVHGRVDALPGMKRGRLSAASPRRYPARRHRP